MVHLEFRNDECVVNEALGKYFCYYYCQPEVLYI